MIPINGLFRIIVSTKDNKTYIRHNVLTRDDGKSTHVLNLCVSPINQTKGDDVKNWINVTVWGVKAQWARQLAELPAADVAGLAVYLRGDFDLKYDDYKEEHGIEITVNSNNSSEFRVVRPVRFEYDESSESSKYESYPDPAPSLVEDQDPDEIPF